MKTKIKDPYSYHLVLDDLDKLTESEIKKTYLKVYTKLAQLILVDKVPRDSITIFCHPRFRQELNIRECGYQPTTHEVIAIISKN